MKMTFGNLGKTYSDGQAIIQQGELGDCMFIIQSGQVEVLHEKDGKNIHLAIRNKGEFIGEMALFEREVRSATIRSIGETRILTIDRRNLLGNIKKDPTLAFKIIESLSHRLRELSKEIAKYK
jgi:CRP-like cAMP-binding protein